VAERTAVLLGAGASRDAGLPLTEEFARRLVESFDEELAAMDRWERKDQEPVVRALHVVYGAMVSHATEQGFSPLSAVNVERLVSAIRLLRDRQNHEAAPFVSSWRPAIEAVDAHPLAVRDSELGEHLGLDSNFNLRVDGLAEKIARIARSTFATGDGTIFMELEQQLLRRICALLSTPTDLQYLSPLMVLARTQDDGLDITTLNYDQTIEKAAEESGVEIDTGLDRWKPGRPLAFSPKRGRINLVKPHGSIDWERRSSSAHDRLEGHPLVRYVYRTGVTPQLHPHWGERSSPLIVIGDREKLATDGPTLALLQAFEESLHRASNLLVVGYSFSDEHVNTVVRNWMNADPVRTVTIVDPGWSNPRMVISADTEMSFKDALIYTAGVSLAVAPGRIVVVKKGAKDGLAEAIHARPLPLTLSLLDISINHGPVMSATITNRGYTLTSIEVRAWAAWRKNPLELAPALRDEGTQAWVGTIQLPDLAHGESHFISLDAVSDPPPNEIEVSAESWAYVVREQAKVITGEVGGSEA
jgi:hypothetical protein